MAYRTLQKARPGEVYCAVMLEWWVKCAVVDCDKTALVAPVMMANGVRSANKYADNNIEGELEGWGKIDGLWYCPTHLRGEGGKDS